MGPALDPLKSTKMQFSMKKKSKMLDMDHTIAMDPTYESAKRQNAGIELLSKRSMDSKFWSKLSA